MRDDRIEDTLCTIRTWIVNNDYLVYKGENCGCDVPFSAHRGNMFPSLAWRLLSDSY